MPLKFGSAARAFLRLLPLLLFFLGPSAAQTVSQKPKSREAHAPRTRAALESKADPDSARDLDDDADREHPREREEWFLKGRLYHGKPAPQMLIRAQQQRDVLRQEAFRARQIREASRALKPDTSSGATPIWTELGPSPLRSVTTAGDDQDYGFVTGRVTAVAVDQTDATGNTVYVGGAYGGVWKSTTAANSDVTKVVWTPVTDDQPTLAIGAIAVGPDASSHNIVLAGTGEANSSADSYYGLGILRSTDGGNSWTQVSTASSVAFANNGLRNLQGLAFSKIVFKTDQPSIVVAATASASEGIAVGAENPANDTADCANLSVTATCRGLYYSYDSGQTWSQAVMADPGGAPDNGSASDVIYNAQEQRFYAWSRAHGLYTSTDGIAFIRAADQGAGSSGQILQPASTINLTNCPTAVTTSSLTNCPIYRGQIAQVPGRDEMYVWFVDSGGKSTESYPADGGIYQTKDGGKTWTSISVATILNCGDSLGCDTEQGDYNLALIAVPNGASATDLYAGAINIYRCQINSNNPTCAANPFVNLTRVYGCTPVGSFANVHPDQHSFDFLISDPNKIYFGNDGGIYRTIAGLNGAIVPTSCQARAPSSPYYPFENLNGTMGSMTQFVWFQQHPTNQFTLLGGTQDNGSPAINSTNGGTNGITWHSVLDGDGGWTDIDPDSLNVWFAENTGVTIQTCSTGVNCSNSQFTTIVNAGKVNGDASAFYMPFMLDPQNSGLLILGTCRIWRITTAGSAPTILSPKFDGSVSGPCDSASPSVVSALAAGGAVSPGGSQVIYAGTADGHVWVTTSADSGASSWADRSPMAGGFSDPSCATSGGCQYPASGIAIDSRDSTGKTAYVTAMGFRVAHVFQTTNAGASWTDITGNLPDSPADGAVVDPASGTIYVATDVGVFSTTSPSAPSTQWTEVGPATGPGTLPNVAVTRVAIFNPQGQPPRLRVSTYGRGIWEMVLPGSSLPDYTLAVGNPSLETFPGQAVTYLGTVTPLNGYDLAKLVLACNAAGVSGALPGACSPSTIDPSTGAFTVTAANSTVQDFSFQIQGNDGNLTRQAPLTLRVVDFSLGAPSPASIPILVHGDSAPVQVQVAPMGSFDQPVTIDCDPASLPAGMSCTASPSSFTPSGTIPVTITINTAVTTAAGNYNPVIRAISTVGDNSVTHTQTLPVTVTAQAGFALDASAYTQQAIKAGQTLTANISLAPHDSPTSTVTLTCAAAGITGPCTVTPSSVNFTVTANNAPVALAINLPTAGGSAASHQVVVTATDGTATSQASLPFSLTDFTMAIGTQPANGAPGSSVGFAFQLTPQNGYNSQVVLACNAGGLGSACTFTPASPTLTPGVTTVVTGSLAIPPSATAGQYAIAITATDSIFPGLDHQATTANFMVQTNPDFDFSFQSTSATIAAGASVGPVPVTLSGTGGFNSSVMWTIAGCQSTALITCTLSPNPATPGQNINLTISTTAPSVSSVRHPSNGFLALWLALPIGGFGLISVKRRRLLSIGTLLLLLGFAACGGGGGGGSTGPPITHPGTPAGTYTIMVTGTAGTTTHQHNFTLTVQ